MKIAEVIERIEKKHGVLPLEKTCDGVIYGNTDQNCTGIILTCNPSISILQQAAELGYNLVICHESTFYHGYDEREKIQKTEVVKSKMDLLDKYGIVIYRDHDQVHMEKQDMIYTGIIKALGWEKYACSNHFFPVSGYKIPETTLEELAGDICRKIHIDGTRIVGDPKMPVKYVGLTAHFLGDDQECIKVIEEEKYDVILSLETVDWTVVAYVMDSNASGRTVGLISPGHFNLEEAGMKIMQVWVEDAVEHNIPVMFLPSGNMFRWVSTK